MAFIDLTNVEIVEEVSEDAKVLVEENGEIKRAPYIIDNQPIIITCDNDGEGTLSNFTFYGESYERVNNYISNTDLVNKLEADFGKPIYVIETISGGNVRKYIGIMNLDYADSISPVSVIHIKYSTRNIMIGRES